MCLAGAYAAVSAEVPAQRESAGRAQLRAEPAVLAWRERREPGEPAAQHSAGICPFPEGRSV